QDGNDCTPGARRTRRARAFRRRFSRSLRGFDRSSQSGRQTQPRAIRSQTVTASGEPGNRSQIVIGSSKHRGPHYAHYAFTEQGVAMLSSVLRSPRAVEVNIAIMRTFVQFRRLMDSNRQLARKIEAMEEKYDEQFAVVFEAIKELIADDEARKSQPKRQI